MQELDESFDKIAICVVTKDNESDTFFFLERLGKTIGPNCEVYIYDAGSTEQMKARLNELCGLLKYNLSHTDLSYSQICNSFLDEVKDGYVCFIGIDTILDTNWISELIYQYKNYENSGCVGIRSQHDRLVLSGLLLHSETEESQITPIWCAENNMIEQPMFFDKSIIDKVGYFDNNISQPSYLFNDFSFRCGCLGYKNYLVKYTSCIKLYVENSYLFPVKTRENTREYRSNVNQMVQTDQYYKTHHEK